MRKDSESWNFLEQRRLKRNTKIFKYLNAEYKEDGARLFSVVSVTGQETMGTN